MQLWEFPLSEHPLIDSVGTKEQPWLLCNFVCAQAQSTTLKCFQLCWEGNNKAVLTFSTNLSHCWEIHSTWSLLMVHQ